MSPTCTSRCAQRASGSPAAARRCGVLAVVAGDGMADAVPAPRRHALDGGPTLNPSTYELLAGIHAVPAEEVVVLPNSPNVVMAAERAAELSEKTVVVVPDALAAGGAVGRRRARPDRGAEDNAAAMARGADHVRTGAVTGAARDDAEGPRFRRGDAVGFIDERIVAWGEPARRWRRCWASSAARPSC